MKAFWHIFKREVSSYFISPIAYVVMSVFLVISGMLFTSNLLWYADISFGTLQNPYLAQSLNLSNDLVRPLFANISVILLFLIPALTMRSFAEEKKSGTMELLLTYPVRDSELILAKYSGSLFFFLIMMLLTLTYPIFLFSIGSPETGPLISAYIGFLLMGASFISIGIFSSATTENQIVAALIAFGLNLFFWIIGWISPSNDTILSKILEYISIIDHYDPLTKGIMNLKDMVYFISICLFFLFLTSRVLISKKWRA